MKKEVALIGNPNSGKTTLFNCLTGSTQHVGNWPGVTVEKKTGFFKADGVDIALVDLPGVYSLSPYSPEEEVTREYLIQSRPDAVVNIIDAANIERSLYLTTQLLEMGLPVLVAVNMIDIIEKNGDRIDLLALEHQLGCPVVACSALKKERCQGVVQALATTFLGSEKRADTIFSESVEATLEQITSLIAHSVAAEQQRWFAVKLFERDPKVSERVALDASRRAQLEALICESEAAHDDDSESIITNERYSWISSFARVAVQKKNPEKASLSDRIDRVVTHRLLAMPIFIGVMSLVYYLSISTLGGWGTDWVNEALFGEFIPGSVATLLGRLGTAEWLNSLILDGILAGVGAVLGFLPQMLVLFFCLAILEDCGYMARIAFIMDRIFRRFGLSGKSFIPMLVGTGCSVPGIMASRTIESESDRRMTIITTSFVPCSAKLPIIALVGGAFFPHSNWVAPSAYFIGIGAVLLSGIILKKTACFSGDSAPFVMELPAYHLPAWRGVVNQMAFRGKSFIKKAGTVIFLASVCIWFLSSFSVSMQRVDPADSMLAQIGKGVAPLFSPLGWGDWKAAVAAITGLIAKENVVSTFGVLYGITEVSEEGAEIWGNIRNAFTPLSIYSFLVFNLLCAPCFAAIGAIYREMGSSRWTWLALGFQTGLAYSVSLILYQFGRFFEGGSFTPLSAIAVALFAGIFYLLLRSDSKKSGCVGKRRIDQGVA